MQFWQNKGNYYSCDKVLTIETSADKRISDGTEMTKQWMNLGVTFFQDFLSGTKLCGTSHRFYRLFSKMAVENSNNKSKLKTYTSTRKNTFTLVTLQSFSISGVYQLRKCKWKIEKFRDVCMTGGTMHTLPAPVIQTFLNVSIIKLRFLS